MNKANSSKVSLYFLFNVVIQNENFFVSSFTEIEISIKSNYKVQVMIFVIWFLTSVI